MAADKPSGVNSCRRLCPVKDATLDDDDEINRDYLLLGRIAVLRTYYVDAARCYRPSSVVCRSVCHSREPCKTAEPIDMPFGMWTTVGAKKQALDGVRIGATRRIRLMQTYVSQIALSNCYYLCLPIYTFSLDFGYRTSYCD